MKVYSNSGRLIAYDEHGKEIDMSQTNKDKRQAERQAHAGEVASKPREDAVHNHPNVPRDTPAEASAKDEQPDSAELRAARALMATPKLTVDNHTVTLYLTHYDIASNTYDGVTIRAHDPQQGEILPIIKAVTGYRPYTADSNSPFVWVELSGDTRLIANLQRHLAAREPEANTEQ